MSPALPGCSLAPTGAPARGNLLIVLASAAASAVGLPVLAGGECGPWLDRPAAADAGPGLYYGVAVARDGAVFAAGRADRTVPGGTDPWPRVARWDGGAFEDEPVDHPSPLPVGMQDASLYDVAALSATEAIAVGTYRRQHVDGFLGWQTLALHLTASGWEHVETPLTPVGGTGADLRDVEMLAADDAWACGLRVAVEFVNVETVGLLLHWDGSAWTELPTPPVLGEFQVLEDLVVLASGEVWCVGGYGPATSSFPYVVRWDGTDWTVFEDLPVPPGLNSLAGIDGDAADDLWMVGRSTTAAGGQVLALRWNGTFFENRTPAPSSLSLLSTRLEQLAIAPSGAVVAVGTGTETPPPAVPLPLALRYEDGAWTEMAVADGGPDSAWIRAMALAGDCSAWAVGQRSPFVPAAWRLEPAGMPDPDLDGDDVIGLGDVLVILSSWGGCPVNGACPADLDGDGAVGLADLLVILAAWTA